MDQITTQTTQTTKTSALPTTVQRFTYDLITIVLWIIEVTMLLRILLKLLGANAGNMIVAFVYSLSGAFAGPFLNMFPDVPLARGVIEPSILIAMVFYAIVAYVLVALLKALRV